MQYNKISLNLIPNKCNNCLVLSKFSSQEGCKLHAEDTEFSIWARIIKSSR